MDTVIPFVKISTTWLDIIAEDMAKGITAAEAETSSR